MCVYLLILRRAVLRVLPAPDGRRSPLYCLYYTKFCPFVQYKSNIIMKKMGHHELFKVLQIIIYLLIIRCIIAILIAIPAFCLRQGGLNNFRHLGIANTTVEKGKPPATKRRIADIANRAKDLLNYE